MKAGTRRVGLGAVVITLAVALGVRGIWADPPTQPSMEKVAPIEELAEQVQAYVAVLDTLLVSPEKYQAAAKQVNRDANTLAVLALALAIHEQDHPLKGPAAGIVPAAQQLSKAEGFEACKTAWEAIHAALESKEGPASAPHWERVASLGPLMTQVTFLNAKLKRGMRASRFESLAQENALHATVLAVLAEATAIDTHEVKDAKDLPDWQTLCGEFRDASVALHSALVARDAAAAQAASVRLEKSCTNCHQRFRIEAE